MTLNSLIATLICVPLMSMIAYAQVSETGPKTQAQSGPTYQLPPAIEKQLAVVKQAAIKCQAQKHGSAELVSAVVTLQGMIPCSARTRQLLQQQQNLHQKMAGAASQSEYEKLNVSARSVSNEIEQDPAYAQVMHAIDARLTPAYSKPAVRTSFPSMSELQPGDILLYDGRTYHPLPFWDSIENKFGEGLIYAQTFTHAALYLGSYGIGGSPYTGGKNNVFNQRTYAADGPGTGVRVDNFLDNSAPYQVGWNHPGLHVAIGRVNNFTMLQNLVTCIRAYNTFHNDNYTHYHKLSPFISWDKTSIKDGLYCSQLVWYVYNQAHVDLDSNDPNYITWFTLRNEWMLLLGTHPDDFALSAVFPDELRSSPRITWYYDQTNP